MANFLLERPPGSPERSASPTLKLGINSWEMHPLADIVHSWKSFMSQRVNQILRRSGGFWFREYFDRFIRDEQHFANAVTYIEQNPAGRLAGGVAVE